MTTTETDLATWLIARIAEDERVALATNSQMMPRYHWEVRETSPRKLPGVFVANEIYMIVEEIYDEAGHHIARWDPARVLAECDTKRKIVALHHPYHVQTRNDGLNWDYRRCVACAEPDHIQNGDDYYPCDTLKLLALPYCGREGYREEWKP